MAKRQPELPGTEAPSIKEIEEAAEVYDDLRQKWQKLGQKLTEAKTNLVTVVTAHASELDADGDGNKTYRYDDILVVLTEGKARVKVKHVSEPEPEEEE